MEQLKSIILDILRNNKAITIDRLNQLVSQYCVDNKIVRHGDLIGKIHYIVQLLSLGEELILIYEYDTVSIEICSQEVITVDQAFQFASRSEKFNYSKDDVLSLLKRLDNREMPTKEQMIERLDEAICSVDFSASYFERNHSFSIGSDNKIVLDELDVDSTLLAELLVTYVVG